MGDKKEDKGREKPLPYIPPPPLYDNIDDDEGLKPDPPKWSQHDNLKPNFPDNKYGKGNEGAESKSKWANFAKIVFPILIIGAVGFVLFKSNVKFSYFYPKNFGIEARAIEDKLHTIYMKQLGRSDPTLAPARDLRGVWASAIWGQGMQLSGTTKTADGSSSIQSNGDIEIKIDRVENGVAYGTVHYFNMSMSGQTVTPMQTITIPKFHTKDSDPTDVQIKIDGSHCSYGPIIVGDTTSTMQGNFSENIISGTLTLTSSYGPINGTFNLKRM